MLLSEAYLLWQKEPENMALYRNTKDAFRLTWLMLPTNKPCAYYTKEVLADAMVKTKTMHDFRVKAGSVMVHVLIYAHKKNSDNPMPAFSFNEVLLMVKEMEEKANKPKKEDDDEKDPLEGIDFKDPELEPALNIRAKIDVPEIPVDKISEKTPAEPCDEKGNALPSDDNPKNETDMKKKKEPVKPAKPRGKLPRPVAQIDPETLQVVKVWPSCSEAERETSARNLTRVIKRKNISGGFFWCYPEDAKGFKPNPFSKPALAQQAEQQEKKRKTVKATEPKPKPATAIGKITDSITQPVDEVVHKPSPLLKSLADFTDAELIHELEQRGWKGDLQLVLKVSLKPKEDQ